MKSEWRTDPLRDVVSYIAKGIPPSYVEAESDKTVRVLNQKCNRNFDISYSESRLHDLSKRSVPEEKYLRDDDILINSTGTGTVGRIAQLSKVPCPTIVDSHMIVLRGNEKVTQRYLGYALKAQQDVILRLDEGSTGQTEMNRDRLLSEIEVSYPVSLSEQDAVAATLTAIDARIAENRKINHHLEQIAQAIFKSWFVDFEPFGGVMPDDWREGKLGDICRFQAGFAFPKEEQGADDTDIPFIKVSDMNLPQNNFFIIASNNWISNSTFQRLKLKLIPNDSVVFAKIGEALKAERLRIISRPTAIDNNMMAAVPLSSDFNEFLLYTLESINLASWAEGSALPFLRQSDLTEIPVVIASPIVLKEFSAIAAPIAREKMAISEESERLSLIRDTILPRLMSGELSVADVDDK